MENVISHNREDLQECQSFIYRIREAQKNKVKLRQNVKSDMSKQTIKKIHV